MDEGRFTRLEQRVDEIKDDVAELKANDKVQQNTLQEIKTDIKQYNVEVKSHVAGDEKIISELTPLLPSLKVIHEIVEQHQYKKMKKEETADKLKTWGMRIGLVTGSIAVVSWILSFFQII